MIKAPFFSILIPTRNRPFLIKKAIESVLCQTFTNYELIVVDNSDNHETENVIKGINSGEIKYIRSGNLNMPDNWELAFKQSSGEYITILTDRMYYASDGVLAHIYQTLQKHNSNIVTWKWSTYDESKDKLIGYEDNGKTKVLSSSEVLAGFLHGGNKRHWFNVTSPKGLNSCISKRLYKEIISKFDRFFYPISPDFTSCFILLYLEETILHLEDGLVVSGGHQHSNGINSVMDKRGTLSYIEQLGINENKAYNFTPIKVISVFNSMYNDLFFVSEMLNWGLNWNMVNKTEYYLLVYGEINNNLFENEKEYDLSKWNTALKHESMSIQKEVRKKITGKEKIKKNKLALFSILRRIYKYKFKHLVASLF